MFKTIIESIRSDFVGKTVNLFLRFASLGGRFILLFIITKYLSIEDLGTYGLINTTITLSVFILGLDFYTFNTREIITSDKAKIKELLSNQFIFHLSVYLPVLLGIPTVLIFNLVTIEFLIYFVLILFFEHISQELYRILLALKLPIKANLTFFIRSSVWVLIVCVLWYFNNDQASLEQIFVFWIFGGITSSVLGFYFIKEYFSPIHLFKIKPNFKWIYYGIKMSMPLFISSVFLKVIEFSDRYAIDFFLTKTDLGIYTFYSSLSKVIQIGVFAIVTMVQFPLLIESFHQGKQEHLMHMKKFKESTLVYSMLFAIVIFIGAFPIINYMNKKELFGQELLYLILILGQVFFCVSTIPHYQLYVRHKDYVILSSTVIGAVMNILLNLILIPTFGIVGAGISSAMGFLIIFATKFFALRYYHK